MHYPTPRTWTSTVNVCIDEDGDDTTNRNVRIENRLTVTGKLTAPTPPRWSEWDGGDSGDPGEIEVTKVRLDEVVVYDPEGDVGVVLDERDDNWPTFKRAVERWALNVLSEADWVIEKLAEQERPERDYDDVDD